VWDCKQDKDTKEWLCVGDEKSPAQTEESYPQPARKFSPSLTEPVDMPVVDERPASSTTARPTKPITAPVAPPVQPVTAQRPKPADVPVVKPAVKPIEPIITQRPQPVEPPAKEEVVESFIPKDQPKQLDNAPVAEEVAPAVSAEKATGSSSDEPIQLPPAATRATSGGSSTTTANKHPGWNCDSSNEEEENWNCQLVGADPKGQAHPVRKVAKESDYSLSLLDPAFDNSDEQNFETLTSKLKYDPWAIDATTQQAKLNADAGKNNRETAPLELTSDFAEIFDNEIGSYLGNVEINRADQHSLSHIANYDKVSQTLDLNGDVYYNEDELALYGHSASIKLASDQSKLRDALFISPATHLRGSSKVVYRDSKTFSRYKDVAYTSCKPGNQDWVLHAEELKLNDISGKGAVKNAWIEFKGVPVFYTPYLSFPKGRQTYYGLLATLTALYPTRRGWYLCSLLLEYRA